MYSTDNPSRQDADVSHNPALKMDNIYRFQRHIYDVTRAYYLLGRNQLIKELDVAPGQTVLEVACGTGRNLIKAAQHYPEAELYGFDVSRQMLATAGKSCAKYKLDARIRLAEGDALEFSGKDLFGVTTFDRIFISYALSMIPGWQRCMAQALEHLAPDGRLLIVDFGEFDSYPKAFQAGQKLWLKQFSVTPIPGLQSELQTIAEARGCTAENKSLFMGYSVLSTIRSSSRPLAQQ